jgi:hypothetical protein
MRADYDFGSRFAANRADYVGFGDALHTLELQILGGAPCIGEHASQHVRPIPVFYCRC